MKFEEAKNELKKLANGDYYSISYEFSGHKDGNNDVVCCVYINDYGSCKRSNWKDVLSVMKAQIEGRTVSSEEMPEVEV